MTNKIIDILNKLDEEKSKYGTNKKLIKQLEDNKSIYQNICVTINYEKLFPNALTQSNRAQINEHDKIIVEQVIKLLKDVYESNLKECEKKIKELVEELKNTPPDATNI